ncbi:AEC family transporter [Hominibacterium faecale]|uniref:AEC family transporter n=1 Tax=Hominibacterium faecale TaxID=2839743 RepID=UPI0022B29496|nr:AEC family transporter [Hominibacterium faecale]
MLIGEILSSLIMIFILILPGIFFRKKELISDHQSEAVSAIVVNLTWPCMVINAMQMEFSFQILKDSGYMMAVALIVFTILIAVSFPLARLLRMSKTKQYMAVFMLIFGNTGFLGIPVIKALYGTEAVFFAAILEMINDVLMFTIGIVLIQLSAGADLKIRAKQFLNPGLIGVMIGLALFLLNCRLPELLGGSIEMIGAATTPLTMFAIGYQLGALKIKEIVGDWQVYVISFVKLLIVPVVTLVIVKLWAGEFTLLEKVLIISFAMPVASASTIFSQQYKGEVAFATKTVLLSTVLSIITIPIFAIIIEL